MQKELLSKFDAHGVRVSTVLAGIHYSTDDERQAYLSVGYIPISDEDHQHYIGNRSTGDNGTGYIRDTKTGKPVSAPPAPPVEEEPQEPPVDTERLVVYEAMAAQEERLAAQAERIAALEAVLKAKGGDIK